MVARQSNVGIAMIDQITDTDTYFNYVRKEEILRKILSKNVKTFRQKAGLSLEQLADKAGVGLHTIHRIEIFDTTPYRIFPSIRTLLLLGTALDKDITEFFIEH